MSHRHHPPPAKVPPWLLLGGGLLIATIVVWVFLGISGIRLGGANTKAQEAAARTCISALTNALNAYHAEYGRWPDFTSNGRFDDEVWQARLMNVLRDKDPANNPRHISFYDHRDAAGTPGHYRDGFHPATGALLDPWGQLYHIALDVDRDGLIPSPYFVEDNVHASAIVWSLGRDGQQGGPTNPRIFQDSDDICSWQ